MAGKLLCHYAEDSTAIAALVDAEGMMDALTKLALSDDGATQYSVAKVCLSLLESKRFRSTAVKAGLRDVVVHLRNKTMDTRAWETADQCLTLLDS